MTIRVLVADDHAAIRVGLVMILSGAEDIEVIGEAGDGATAVRLARALWPDVVLMDVRAATGCQRRAVTTITGTAVTGAMVATTSPV